MADGQNSPYSAMSAMAIDPIYIALADVEEFAAAGGEPSLPDSDRAQLEEARRSPRVAYQGIRAIKSSALAAAFDRFERNGMGDGLCEGVRLSRVHGAGTMVARRLCAVSSAPSRARKGGTGSSGTRGFAFVSRPRSSARGLVSLGKSCIERGCNGSRPSSGNRRAAGARGVRIFGDFPFVVSADSADVWARQHEFRVDASVGTPPDDFSATGQDWGLPVYRWDVIERSDYEWLKQRARRCTELFDGFRVDHLIGFYRTYYRERDKRAAFLPPDEPSQISQGERILRLLASFGSQIVAEDLGTVPDFVRCLADAPARARL